MFKVMFALILSTLLVGCVVNYDDSIYNPFVQFYHGESKEEILSNPTYELDDQALTLLEGRTISDDVEWYESRGFSCVGYSSFEATSADLKYAIGFGRKLGAKIALGYKSYTRTSPGMITLDTGMGISLSNDASRDKYNIVVTYWVKRKPYILGAIFRELSKDQKIAIDRNRGVYIKNVVIGSPAFNADILPGDCLLSIDGLIIDDKEFIKRALTDRKGKNVVIEVFRSGKIISKAITLNSIGIE